jgi:uncharacterized protein YegP (UPF0339 family)/uncharacterized surface protein with fasciclin (FAS1) repeats
MEDIVDIAVEAGGFKTFVAAVKAAGLVEILKDKGPFTIFVPDDGAFALLPAGTVDELLKNVPKLKAILMYHVIPGKFTIDEIAQMKTAKTVQGQELKIHGTGWWHLHMNPIINDDAHIKSTDIVTESGIIHVVDRVLMPNMALTCPVCGMGFMTKEAITAHTQTAHIVEKTPEPMPVPEVTPVVEAAPEPMPPTEVITEQMPELAKVTGVFEVFVDAAGRLRFHLKAANGQIIAVSQSYGTKESALKGIASIKKNAPIAKAADFTTAEPMPESTHRGGIVQDPVFEIQCNAPDKFRFHLKAANGEIIAVSQSYLTRQSAEKGVASVKKNAPMAKIIDQTTAMT